MKLSKEELKAKVNEMVSDTDLAIQLLEDIEDSFEAGNNEEMQAKIDELQAKFDELQQKYKERFLNGSEEKKEDEEETEELTEEEVIDVKEI